MELDQAINIIRSSPEIKEAIIRVLDIYEKKDLNVTVEHRDPWDVARAQGAVQRLRWLKNAINKTALPK